MTRLQNIAGLEPTWLVTCDVPHCTAQEALIPDRDVRALAIDGVIEAFIDEHEVERKVNGFVRTIACGRGWVPGTHVGEPNHWRCPAHAGVLRG